MSAWTQEGHYVRKKIQGQDYILALIGSSSVPVWVPLAVYLESIE